MIEKITAYIGRCDKCYMYFSDKAGVCIFCTRRELMGYMEGEGWKKGGKDKRTGKDRWHCPECKKPIAG